MPGVSAETHDARGVLARLSDVIRQVVSQAGVCDAARATLALHHRGVLTHQHGADQGPAVDLPLLQRRTQVKRKRDKRRELRVGRSGNHRLSSPASSSLKWEGGN